MRRSLAGDSDGYFQDFNGSVKSIAATARQGWFYTGQHAPFFGHERGTDPSGLRPAQFAFFLQNHDQIGNRAFGDRLHHKIDLAGWRAASVLLLMLPETPLLFMGQEWAASSPFLYFTDHFEELGRLVTEGRRREFGRFAAFADPAVRESIPDPQSEQTVRESHLHWIETAEEPHASSMTLYRELLALRKTLQPSETPADITPIGDSSLMLQRTARDGSELSILVRLHGSGRDVLPASGKLELVLTTEDPPFSADPHPAHSDIAASTIDFARPGAVIFRASVKRKKRRA
jgi:maltooligosyltrehalose trehalohydrolase